MASDLLPQNYDFKTILKKRLLTKLQSQTHISNMIFVFVIDSTCLAGGFFKFIWLHQLQFVLMTIIELNF